MFSTLSLCTVLLFRVGFYPAHGLAAIYPRAASEFIGSVDLGFVVKSTIEYVEKHLVWELFAFLW